MKSLSLDNNNQTIAATSYTVPVSYSTPSRHDDTGQNTATALHKYSSHTQSFPDLAERTRLALDNHDSLFQGLSLNSGYKSSLTVKIAEINAGFKNTFGVYSVDDNGTIQSAAILSKNTRDLEQGQNFSFENETPGHNVHFFLIANGYARNHELHKENLSEGSLHFINGYGTDDARPANINDDPSLISLIYKTDSKDIVLNGPIYHTASNHLNYDGKPHAVSGLSDHGANWLRIGFEDFPNLGDADFNDIVFDVQVAYELPAGTLARHSDNPLNTHPSVAAPEDRQEDRYEDDLLPTLSPVASQEQGPGTNDTPITDPAGARPETEQPLYGGTEGQIAALIDNSNNSPINAGASKDKTSATGDHITEDDISGLIAMIGTDPLDTTIAAFIDTGAAAPGAFGSAVQAAAETLTPSSPAIFSETTTTEAALPLDSILI